MTGVDYGNNAGGKDWNRNIKKEYGEFIRRVRALMERLNGSAKAVDVERVGWVLGKEKAVIQIDHHVHSHDPQTSKPAASKKEKSKPAVKRKTAEATQDAARETDTRRSKRLRK